MNRLGYHLGNLIIMLLALTALVLSFGWIRIFLGFVRLGTQVVWGAIF